MKYLMLCAVALVLLSSCTSTGGLPEPEGAGNSLVVGSLVLDFPDGFFDQSARKIENRVFLNFRNTTKNSTFDAMTGRPGMFSFVSNGSDEYVLESFEFRDETGSSRYSLGVNPLNAKFAATPDRVLYIGHITVTYAKAKAITDFGTGGSTWKFDKSLAVNWDKNAVRAYIEEKNPKSEWLKREVLEVKLQAAK